MRLRNLVIIGGLLACPVAGYAVTCSVSNVQTVNFGAVNPLPASSVTSAMTFNYSCAKELGDVLAGINLCFNIGISGVSGQVTTRTCH